MLPFLKKKNESAGIIGEASLKNGEIQMDEEMSDLEMVMEELIAAVQAGDAKGAASAMQAAFQICDSAPHEEGPHL